jgi:PAS domain S-box-containing protein
MFRSRQVQNVTLKTEATENRPASPASQSQQIRGWLEGGSAVLDLQGRILRSSPPLTAWFETPGKKLESQSFCEVLSGLCGSWKPQLQKAWESPADFSSIELRLPALGAEPSQWFSLEFARGPENCFARFNSILAPLAEIEESGWDDRWLSDAARREILARFLRAEARLEALTRRWPCVILSQRPDFSVQSASPNIEELTGISAADWQNRPNQFWEIVHEADATELQRQFKHCAETGQVSTSTYRIRHGKTGRVAYILEHREPVRTRNGLAIGFEVLWLDVTRQTVAERRLSAVDWKNTLAVVTLGMAHDFTNMIAGIHSLSESYLSQLTLSHPFYDGLSLIKKTSLQASQLVRRIINLHVGKVGESNYHDLNAVVSDLVDLCRKALSKQIQLSIELEPGTLPVYMDAVEFRQVLLNLLLNAADAMPKGGLLTVRTSKHATMPEVKNLRGVPPRLPCVCLTIEDTGVGISERHLGSVFDPFFTTKSKGSGLGLYNARLTVEKHHGAISVSSKERIGTMFQIWLPEADFSETQKAEASGPRVQRCLLLWGPPGDLRDRTAEQLRGRNYGVVIASSSDPVSDLLNSGDYRFDGAVMLVERNDPEALAFAAELRDGPKKPKLALRLAGCAQDELDDRVLKSADLILNLDLSEAEMFDKLQSLFDSK